MKELGAELILAHSPQAKGRVERRNALFQDRLVKEMRLRNIRDLQQANVFLEGVFLADLNRRYAVKASKDQDLHRSVAAGLVLEEILCVQDKRVVGNDWCVRWNNRWLQIDASHAALNLPGRKVLVKHLADGKLIVEHEGKRLIVGELAARPQPQREKKPIVNNRTWKPAAGHPSKSELARRAGPPPTLAPVRPARGLVAEKRMQGDTSTSLRHSDTVVPTISLRPTANPHIGAFLLSKRLAGVLPNRILIRTRNRKVRSRTCSK